MKRRQFLTLLSSAALWPHTARAQQMPVIGVLCNASPESFVARLVAFRQGLSEAGFVEDRNVRIEYRWANDRYDRLPELAADLVRSNVNVIATVGAFPAALAAKNATTTIPIVFQVGANPVQRGLVTSLSRPGGNLTGVTSLNGELGPKRLELLHEIAPKAATLTALFNPSSPTVSTDRKYTEGLEAAARTLGVEFEVLLASDEAGIETAFARLSQERIPALMIRSDPFFNARVDRLAALTLRYKVPTIFQYREFAAGGGLISYGGDFTGSSRQVGAYVGRILKGESPIDLPVQQYTKIELFVNLQTAKAMGLAVPLSLLGRADEVIE